MDKETRLRARPCICCNTITSYMCAECFRIMWTGNVPAFLGLAYVCDKPLCRQQHEKHATHILLREEI